MKKYIIITIFAFTAASCSDFLDRKPVSDLTADSFWQTANDAEVGVVAIYNAFSKAVSPGVWDWGELRADNFIPHRKDAMDQTELISNTIQNDNQSASWTDLYATIARCNEAIKYIPRISMPTAAKNQLLAEAHAMRAWAYFYCVRVWGDVPLYTEPVSEISDGIYRERTASEVILNTVVLPDLERSYYLIQKRYDNRSLISFSRVNVATVLALMMDVNAWMHDYENVVRIMEEKVSALSRTHWGLSALNASTFADDWRAIFFKQTRENTPVEVFFKISYDQLGNGESLQISYFASSQPRVFLSDKIKGAVYDPISDKRFGGTQWEEIGDNLTQLKRKFWPTGTVFTGAGKIYSDNSIVLYRYADLTLLYAEALNEIDRPADAIAALNRTRTRAGNAAWRTSDFTDKREILDAILDERQKEFLGEGKRWFDLVRTGKWKEVMEPINGMNQEWQILFPVHRQHLIQNHNLSQNDGYAN